MMLDEQLHKMSGKGFLAVIPARGGSVGLPGKNLLEVQGISLVARAVLMARKIKEIRWIIVSTDDPAIAREAERAGGTVPFMRPARLSKGDTPMLAVLQHAFQWFQSSMPDQVRECQGMLLLQPTSPMRRKEHIVGVIDLYTRKKRNGTQIAGVHSVSPVPSIWMPSKLWRKEEIETSQEKGYPMVRNRVDTVQDRLYYRNCAAIMLDPWRLNALTLAVGPVAPYIINRHLMTIDTLHDLLYIEHCGGKLEPDPIDIDWKSLQNKDLHE